MEDLINHIARAHAGSQYIDDEIAKIAGYQASFSTSIDAMMVLVAPAFLRLEPVFYDDEGDVRWKAFVIMPNWSRWSPHDDWFNTHEGRHYQDPCLAALVAWLTGQIAVDTG